MRFHAVAVDFDGTLAHDGIVSEEALEALRALRKSGRRPILATGRIVDQLAGIFPHLDLFDAVVAENGAVLFDPSTGRLEALAKPPPSAFVERLVEKGVPQLEVGRVIVATRQPHETAVLQTLHELGLEIGLTFNKGAVMALPSGVTKASGLARQLELFKLSFHNVLGIGDAENDLGFLSRCEASAAVANALPSVKEACDIVAAHSRGRGVCDVIERLIADDLQSVEAIDRRHRIVIGKLRDGETFEISAACPGVLVAGTSGGGKSRLVAGFIERTGDLGYHYCVIDPEGDFADLDGAIPIGSVDSEPSLETVQEVLINQQNAVISLLSIKIEDRSSFARRLLGRIAEIRTQFGRPHWIVIDEAHHVFPAQAKPRQDPYDPAGGTMLITTQPSLVAREALHCTKVVVAVGQTTRKTIEEARAQLGIPGGPLEAAESVPKHRALVWRRDEPAVTRQVETIPGKLERRRHARKYAQGELAEEKSFFFTGPHRKLRLRAQNLLTFVQIGEGVDDDTWTHHLRRHDYSHWVHEAIGDDDLAAELRAIEDERKSSPEESRRRVADAVRKRYTSPA
jgi:HAD superfamily hydrolase (TIGR01484 family)